LNTLCLCDSVNTAHTTSVCVCVCVKGEAPPGVTAGLSQYGDPADE